MSVRTKRAYAPPSPEDGARYLIDRIWPRGVSAERLALTEWRKDLAPSDTLRRWYGHEPARFAAFRDRYRAELLTRPAALDALRRDAAKGTITLVFGARDPAYSNAAVLAELLQEGTERGRAGGPGALGNGPRQPRRRRSRRRA